MTMDDSEVNPVRLGVVGLGRAFMLMLPTFMGDERVRIAGAATGSLQKQRAFAAQFGHSAVSDTAALLANPDIDAVYIATPHELHRQNVVDALRANKHVLVEKPMTITSADAAAITGAVRESGREVIVGPSHSFDKPIVEAAKLIASGKYGPVGMINAHYYTDFVYRPRRPEELDRAHGGGVVFNQGAHHVDILMTLAGSMPIGVYGSVGDFDSRRPCDGAYSALVEFSNGCVGSITYSGYAHYDSDAEQGWIGELGTRKAADSYGVARQRLQQVDNEVAAKESRGFGDTGDNGPAAVAHEHFGTIIISCEKADIKPTAEGIHIYADDGYEFIPLPLEGSPRAEVISELYRVVRCGEKPVHSAARGYLNVAVCEALYESFRHRRRVALRPDEEGESALVTFV